MKLFDVFLVAHVIAGAIGVVAFWAPVLSRKGGRLHRKGGTVFYWCMLIAGGSAVGMSTLTLVATPELHHGFADKAFVRGIFGWMMLYLAILTISLAWHGMAVVANKANHAANRRGIDVPLQVVTLVAALNCALQGVLIGQVLMVGMSLIGIASAVTNLAYAYGPAPTHREMQKEHLKALVGAGISVYTAFSAFGSVRLAPWLALNPILWSIPLVIGLGIILTHWWRLSKPPGGGAPRLIDVVGLGGRARRSEPDARLPGA
jgi:hypothetical protein